MVKVEDSAGVESIPYEINIRTLLSNPVIEVSEELIGWKKAKIRVDVINGVENISKYCYAKENEEYVCEESNEISVEKELIDLEDNKEYTIKVKAITEDELESPEQEIVIKTDKMPVMKVSGTNKNNDWSGSDSTITITEEKGSGEYQVKLCRNDVCDNSETNTSWLDDTEGVESICYKAINSKTQEETVPECYVSRIDKTPPTCGVAENASTEWTNVARTINQYCTDENGSGCEQDIYTTTYSSGTTSTKSITISDKVGNNQTCTYNVYVDKDAPTCGVAENSSNQWTNAARTINQYCTDENGSGCVQAVYTNTYASGTTTTGSAVISDSAGNSQTCTYNVYVDKDAPTCGAAENASIEWTNATRTIKQHCTETGGSGCAKATFDATYDSGTTTTGSIAISDAVGNSQICSYNVYVDKDAPTCGTAENASIEWTNVNRTIKQHCTETNGSGCAKVTYDTTYDSGTTTTGSIVISDAVGNSQICSYNVYVDKDAPTCGTAENSSNVWTNTARTINQYCTDENGSGCVQAVYTNTYASGTTTTGSAVISDTLGNSRTCTYNVYVDKDAPTCGTVNKTTTYSTSGVSGTVGCTETVGSGCSSATFSFTDLRTTSNVAIRDTAGNSRNCPVTVSCKSVSTGTGHSTESTRYCQEYNTKTDSACGCISWNISGCTDDGYCISGYRTYANGGNRCYKHRYTGKSGGAAACSTYCSSTVGVSGSHYDSYGTCECYEKGTSMELCSCLQYGTCDLEQFGCKTWGDWIYRNVSSCGSDVKTNSKEVTCRYYPDTTCSYY